MTTDLSKILSVTGKHGLYRYLAQARAGVIAESLSDGKRTLLDAHSRISSLADISIYTDEGEVKLAEVFTAIKNSLEGEALPDPKASEEHVRALFDKALPGYDSDRFHLSHMRKVLSWYGELAEKASLDFASDEEVEETADEA